MLHRVGDWLLKHCEILDGDVYSSERELLGLSRTIVIYDSTNVHFCGYAREAAARTGQAGVPRPPAEDLGIDLGRHRIPAAQPDAPMTAMRGALG